MNARSLCALSFCAFTVPAVLYLPSAGWLWAGASAVGAALFLGLLLFLRRRKALDLVVFLSRSGWGKGALCLLTAWDLLILGAAAGRLCDAYPTGTPYPIIGIFLLFMAAWSAGNGSAVRVGAVTFFFLAGLYALILAFALPETRWSATVPAVKWAQLPAALCPVCALFLCRSDSQKTRVWPWLTGGAVLAILCALVCSGVDGVFPFYTVAQSLSVFGVAERFEPLVSSALTAGGFCLLALLCQSNARTIEILLPHARRSAAAVLNFSAGCLGLWAAQRLPEGFLAGGTAIFWGLLPLGTLLVANLKNFEKIEKKC